MKLKSWIHRLSALALCCILLLALCPAALAAGPGAADLDAVDSKITYPKAEYYLDSYVSARVKAPRGFGVYMYEDPKLTMAAGYSIVQNDSAVTVLAEYNGYSCVILLNSGESGWIDSRYLVTIEESATGYDPDAAADLGANTEAMKALRAWTDITQVAIGYDGEGEYILGLKKDGTVVAAGSNAWGQCDVSSWRDITQISASRQHAVGLKKDGTVVAAGSDEYEQCRVEGLRDMVKVEAGTYYTAGIDKNGDWVFVGYREYDPNTWFENGEYPVRWEDLSDICCRNDDLLALRNDGTVLYFGFSELGQRAEEHYLFNRPSDKVKGFALGGDYSTPFALELTSTNHAKVVGDNSYSQKKVTYWKTILDVAAGEGHAVALEYGGSVEAMGLNTCGQCEVDTWNGVSFVACGRYCTVGVAADGTLRTAGYLF